MPKLKFKIPAPVFSLSLSLSNPSPMTLTVGFLGPEGTYSHQAARQQFESYKDKEKIIYKPLPTIASCFKSLETNDADYTVVPFENSTNGQVVPTYDLFKNSNEKIDILAEQFVSIHHNFITFGNDMSKITKVYSHPQAWGQCTKFLAKYELDNKIKVELIDTSSTAKAVENLIALNSHEKLTTAAIASRTASELFNVPILFENIEEFSGNTTRFLVLGKDKNLKITPGLDEVSSVKMHLVTFVIKKNDNFGSLCDILALFKRYGLNLQTITTRPSQDPWRYVFFVEVWHGDGFTNCLLELQELVIKLRDLGGFYRSRKFLEMLGNPKEL